MFMIEKVDEIRHFYQFTLAAQSSYPLLQSRSDPAKPQQPMEFLGFLVIGLVIAILVLPFVALAKVNRTKRVVQDLAGRVASLENELRNLRLHSVSPVQPEARVAAPEPRAEPAPTTDACDCRVQRNARAAANPTRALHTESAATRQTSQTADQLGAFYGCEIVRLDRRARAFPRHRVFREILVRARFDPTRAP